MRVTGDMKINEVLMINENMIEAFIWLSPQFERLRHPRLRRLMAQRVTVAQAARIARVPLAQLLYLLNLNAGEEEKRLVYELREMGSRAFRYQAENPPRRPPELIGLQDTDPRVHFIDMTPLARRNEDPQPVIMHELTELRDATEVLLVRHPYDPIPLRDLLTNRGFASWAEERRPGDYYIYFYRPSALAGAVARPPVEGTTFVRAMAMGA